MQRLPRETSWRVRLGRASLALAAAAIVAGIALVVASQGYCVLPRLRVDLVLVAAQLLVVAPLALLRTRRLLGSGASAGSVAGSLALFALAGVVGHLVLRTSLAGAIDRGAQKRTMADMRTIARAIESHASREGRYPDVDGSAEDLARVLAPGGAGAAIPTHDAWGPAPFLVRSSALSYRIVSHGCDCRPDDPGAPVAAGGGTTSYASDIIFDTGSFVQFPDGTQR